MATTIAVQDFCQLKKDYGVEQTEVIIGIVGNVISGRGYSKQTFGQFR